MLHMNVLFTIKRVDFQTEVDCGRITSYKIAVIMTFVEFLLLCVPGVCYSASP